MSLNVLQAAGMGPHDLVKVTIFLTDRGHLQILRDIRDAMLQGAALGGYPDLRSRSGESRLAGGDRGIAAAA